MPEPLTNGKEIVKACVLALVLMPLTVFCSSMLAIMLADLVISGKPYHHPKDVGGEVCMVAMAISAIACIGFAIAATLLVLLRPRILPSWAAIMIGIMMPGFVSLGNKLYHAPNSVPGVLLAAFLLTSPPACAACFIFRITLASRPEGTSVIRPLSWAFGSIFATSTLLAFLTVFIGGLPWSEMPTR